MARIDETSFHTPQCFRIFSTTALCLPSMKAMIHIRQGFGGQIFISAAHLGQLEGPTSHTCLVNAAHRLGACWPPGARGFSPLSSGSATATPGSAFAQKLRRDKRRCGLQAAECCLLTPPRSDV